MIVWVIKPSMFGEQTRDALPPLLFALLKPLTPPDITLVFFDENIEPVPFSSVDDPACDAVAITIDTFTSRRGYLIAAEFRLRGIPVILGGIHVTLCPKEAAAYADTLIIGEAEDTWSACLSDLQSKQLQRHYVSANHTPLSEVTYDYQVFKEKKYHPLWIIQFSRGCRFSCDFCSIPALLGKSLRTRSPGAVVETIRQLPGKLLFFADDNLFSDYTRLFALLDALEPLRRRWVCQISMEAAFDLDLLRRLRRSGCIMVIMGFESLEIANLRQMNKHANLGASLCENAFSCRPARSTKPNVAGPASRLGVRVGPATSLRDAQDDIFSHSDASSLNGLESKAHRASSLLQDYETAISNIKNAELMLYGTFVIGYDADTKETACELAAFAKKHGFAIANFNPLIPTPGTALYTRLEQEGRLLYDHWWNDPDYRYGDTVFSPAGMTPAELAESCRKARFSFYAPRSILARLRGVSLKGFYNAGVYLLANIVSRASIHQKQGRRLGA